MDKKDVLSGTVVEGHSDNVNHVFIPGGTIFKTNALPSNGEVEIEFYKTSSHDTCIARVPLYKLDATSQRSLEARLQSAYYKRNKGTSTRLHNEISS